MLNPSRTLVISLALVALAGLVLGLATAVGLFGWSLAAGLTHLARPSTRRPA